MFTSMLFLAVQLWVSLHILVNPDFQSRLSPEKFFAWHMHKVM